MTAPREADQFAHLGLPAQFWLCQDCDALREPYNALTVALSCGSTIGARSSHNGTTQKLCDIATAYELKNNRRTFQQYPKKSRQAAADNAVSAEPISGWRINQHPHSPSVHSVAIQFTAPTSCATANSAKPIKHQIAKFCIRFITASGEG